MTSIGAARTLLSLVLFEPTTSLASFSEVAVLRIGTWFLGVKIRESASAKRAVSNKISLIVNIVTVLVRDCLTTSIKLET